MNCGQIKMVLLPMEPWAAAKKALSQCSGATSSFQVPNQRPLVPSVTSVTNDEGDNEMIPEAVHRSPGIFLAAEESPGNPMLGDRLMK